MKRQSGFTLIEVLVAMVIVGLGLLGLAALQMESLKNNLSAYNNSQASQLAYDLADRVRANRADAALYGNSAYLKNSARNDSCLTINGCTAAQLAGNDLFQWQQAVDEAFSGAKKTAISYSAATGFFTVSLTWDDNRDSDADGHVGAMIGDSDNDGDTDDDPIYEMSFKL